MHTVFDEKKENNINHGSFMEVGEDDANNSYKIKNGDHVDENEQEMKDCKLNVNATQFVPKWRFNPATSKSMLNTIDEKEEKETKPMIPKNSQRSKYPLPIKCAGTIEIPRNLTQNIIPSTIEENIANIYYFMDKSMALRANKKILENDKVVIINYDFHDMDSDEILYCIIKKQDPSKHRGFSWIMIDRLFNKKEILIEFNISEKELILPSSSRLDMKIIQQINNIHSIHDILETQLIFGIVERTQWHRIPIYDKTNNKQRKVLYLTKKEFMKRIEYFIVNTRNINIIPIMMLNSNKEYWIEHIYIIKIDENIHIGISMKYKSHQNRVEVTGIHLNKEYILNKHQLAAPHFNCSCLEHFRSDIDGLKIGNIDEDKNRIKDLQKRHEIIKHENDTIKNENTNLKKKEEFYKKKYFELKKFVQRCWSEKMPISQFLTETKDHLDNDDDDDYDLSPISMIETQSIGTNTNTLNISPSMSSIPCIPSYRIPILSLYPLQTSFPITSTMHIPVYNPMVQQQITSPVQSIIYVQDETVITPSTS